jgi:lipoate synthase
MNHQKEEALFTNEGKARSCTSVDRDELKDGGSIIWERHD